MIPHSLPTMAQFSAPLYRKTSEISTVLIVVSSPPILFLEAIQAGCPQPPSPSTEVLKTSTQSNVWILLDLSATSENSLLFHSLWSIFLIWLQCSLSIFLPPSFSFSASSSGCSSSPWLLKVRTPPCSVLRLSSSYIHFLGYSISFHSFKSHLTAVIRKFIAPAQTHL